MEVRSISVYIVRPTTSPRTPDDQVRCCARRRLVGAGQGQNLRHGRRVHAVRSTSARTGRARCNDSKHVRQPCRRKLSLLDRRLRAKESTNLVVEYSSWCTPRRLTAAHRSEAALRKSNGIQNGVRRYTVYIHTIVHQTLMKRPCTRA